MDSFIDVIDKVEGYIDWKGIYTPLILACKFNRVKFVKYLIMRGVDIDTVNRDGDSALMIATD